MSSDNILDKVKKLRELTGVGFKDCKNAIDNCNGDIENSIEFLRIKGIAKAYKKMERIYCWVSISSNPSGSEAAGVFSIGEATWVDFVSEPPEHETIKSNVGISKAT